jgi:MFS family permease
MLVALATAFALSQAFRTVGAMMATPLTSHFGLTPQQLGTWAGTFHFMFGIMQLAMGVSIDMFGVRRTVLTAFPLAIAGAVLCAMAPNFHALLLGQALIGVGCAPAFLACTVFIARHFDASRFTAMSGLVMSLAGMGILFTGTPLALLIEASSWRVGYAVLGAFAVLSCKHGAYGAPVAAQGRARAAAAVRNAAHAGLAVLRLRVVCRLHHAARPVARPGAA